MGKEALYIYCTYMNYRYVYHAIMCKLIRQTQCPGGNKYRNLALQLGGVSKTETIKYAHETRGTQT
jgi:hypothetical protein